MTFEQIMLKLHGEIVSNPDAPLDMRTDSLHHIALLSGAIDSFTNSRGETVKRVSPRVMAQVLTIFGWEQEDQTRYLPEDFPKLVTLRVDPMAVAPAPYGESPKACARRIARESSERARRNRGR